MSQDQKCPPMEVYLTVKGGLKAIEFYKEAFGATETFKMMAEDGERVMHANMTVFGAQIMLSDEMAEFCKDVAAPPTVGGASITIHVNLATADEVDAAMAKAAKAGAEITMPAEDMFWGAHYGRLRDAFGHVWSFGAALADQEAGS